MDCSLLSIAWPLLALAGGADDTTPSGRYVEARTASVFAGACHYGSEATTQGREALLAWHFEGGRHAGVDLSGVDVALALAGEHNLAEVRGVRRALLYVSDAASSAQVDAALDLLRGRHPGLFGRTQPARRVSLKSAFAGEAYSIEAPGLFALHGAALPDRACCKMPQAVWYAPLAPLEGALVGHNDLFRFADKALGGTWSRTDENSGFTGGFRFAAREGSAR